MLSAKQGFIIDIGIALLKFSRSSLTLKIEVRHKMTRETLLSVDKIIIVHHGEDDKPAPQVKVEVESVKNRLDDKLLGYDPSIQFKYF